LGKVPLIKFPADIDWRGWIERWDKMQNGYLPRRAERFELMLEMIAATQRSVTRVLDIGCGTGSLMLPVLQRFREAEVFGIDFDPTLLALAERRLSEYGDRVHLVQADLRNDSWLKLVPNPMDAAVSATALHWLNPEQLERFYGQLARILRSGGVFLNADHVRNDCESVQEARQRHRDRILEQERDTRAEDWEGFWEAYGRALKIDIDSLRRDVTGPWEGSEEGLPLDWHFEKLKTSGFEAVDCFWRCDCDAIYGGIRQSV
jgi:SAM-dependent methyltransferase